MTTAKIQVVVKKCKDVNPDDGFNVEEEGASAASPEKRQRTPTNDI
jgi:hypothetical protein